MHYLTYPLLHWTMSEREVVLIGQLLRAETRLDRTDAMFIVTSPTPCREIRLAVVKESAKDAFSVFYLISLQLCSVFVGH